MAGRNEFHFSLNIQAYNFFHILLLLAAARKIKFSDCPKNYCLPDSAPTPRGQRENAVPAAQPSKSIIFFRFCFATATISALLSCTKMVKIVAVKSVFASKISRRLNVFSAFLDSSWLGRETPFHSPPFIDAFGASISSVFGAKYWANCPCN